MNKPPTGSVIGKNEAFEDQIDALKDSMRGLADLGSARAHEIKDRVVGATDGAVSSAETYLGKLTTLIKGHPLLAVGIAVGIGYLAMRIVRR